MFARGLGHLRSVSVVSAIWFASTTMAPCVAQESPEAQRESPAAAGAAASQADSGQVEEVVITATRTSSMLSRTPVSVGVLDGGTIDRKGVTQLSDLVGLVAGVTVPNGFSNMPQAVGIRGVGMSQPASTQAVGIYVDEVPLVRGYATALWDLPDIERIEVLRGPQGTLYGQNSSAGAVKIVSRPPTRLPEAWASLTVGNRGAREAHAYVSGPLGEQGLAGSLAVSIRRNDGFGYNITRREDVNRLSAGQFRAKLRWAAGDTDAVLAVDGLQDRSDTNTVNYPRHAGVPPRVTLTSAHGGDFQRLAGGMSLHVSRALDHGLVLKSISAYRTFRDDPTLADFGGLQVMRFGIDQVVEQRALSQELQLQSRSANWTWTTGVIAVADEFQFDRHSTAFPVTAGAPIYSEAITKLKTFDVGAYLQTRWAWSERTGVTLGLRAYRTRQWGSNENWITDASQRRLLNVYDASNLSTSSAGLLPRLGIDHQISKTTFLYASLAQGEKFGGFNRAATSLASAKVAADPESVAAFELGAKGRYLDGILSANLALFYNDYRDYLAALNNLTIDGVLIPDAVLVNAGRAHTYGADLELTVRPLRRLALTATAELLRSRFDQFVNPTGATFADYVGNSLPYAPKTSLGLSLNYTLALASAQQVEFNAGLRHVARQFTDPANSPSLVIPKQTYLDFGMSVSTASRDWVISLRVKNAQDRTYAVVPNVIAPLGVDAAYFNPPRTILLTARRDF